MSRRPVSRLATFVPEMKGKPGKIALWGYPVAETPVASRSSFRAQVRCAIGSYVVVLLLLLNYCLVFESPLEPSAMF